MSSEKLRKALTGLADKRMKVAAMSGTVQAVDGYLCDVRPSDGGAVFHDVRLKVAATDDDGGTYAIPNVGSKVLMAMLDNNQNSMVVVQVEDVKEYVVKVRGGAELRVLPNGAVSINGEAYGGLVKVQELRTELGKVNTYLEALRTAIQTCIISPGDGGAALKTAMAGAISGTQLPTYTNIESTKTKHGGL